MRLLVRARQHVCLPCLLGHVRRAVSTASVLAREWDAGVTPQARPRLRTSDVRLRRVLSVRLTKREPSLLAVRRANTSREYASSTSDRLELSPIQQHELQTLRLIRNKMRQGLPTVSPESEERRGLTIEDVLKRLPEHQHNSKTLDDETRLTRTVERVYAGRTYVEVEKDLDRVLLHRKPSQRYVEDQETKQVLGALGLLAIEVSKETGKQEASDSVAPSEPNSTLTTEETSADIALPANLSDSQREEPKTAEERRRAAARRRAERKKRGKLASRTRSLSARLRKIPSTSPRALKTAAKVRRVPSSVPETSKPVVEEVKHKIEIAKFDENQLQRIYAKDVWLKPLAIGEPKVPSLSFDLSRVLFNPGVYQLQDPRSRVYNFDPYLAQIMPVSEFNYDALNGYITSSEDKTLRDLAQKYQKRYIGSSSSLSGVLQHFHYLLSGWRPINHTHLSRSFTPESTNFTTIHRSPTAVFLRYKDGVYAIDADKEYDSANILMSLGKSMEKLFTLEKSKFEQYRKSDDADKMAEFRDTQPEQYHYGEIGQFLMRSQLDAYDPRLPGTGMFDLKTRAVAAIRMNLRNHEKGMDYQIKDRFGEWESYEREYYDMIRSAFLKYSLQVRMGRMDGIFVAYHNIQRIFGFQYISLPDLDVALHGQSDRSLGDQEFGLSVGLLNDIFNRITTAFPAQTLRFHVETREKTSKKELVPYMYVFAEPFSEEEADRIQHSKKEEIADFERKLFSGLSPKAMKTSASTEASDNANTGQAAESVSAVDSNAANVEFLDGLDDLMLKGQSEKETPEPKPLIGFKVVIRNRVNGNLVPRPQNLSKDDSWVLEYTITELEIGPARSKYTLLKNRRMTALDFSDEDIAASRYIRNLMRMSERGAEWRKEMDEIDAQREPVVLYGDKSAPVPS